MHLYTLKHQLRLTFKTLKKLLKKPFSDVTPTCFGPLIRPSSGGSYAVLCAVTRLGSADLRSLIVYAVCGCMCLSSVLCVWLVFLSGWDVVISQISPWQEHQPHTHTHKLTISIYSHILHNQRTQISRTQPSNSTKHGIWTPWEWSNEWTETCRGNVTKRFFFKFFSVLNVNVSWCFKVCKCMRWNKQQL